MSLQSIIRCKRDGQALSTADIRSIVTGIADHQLSDAQLAAFGIAIYLNGMSVKETANLALAMRDSGQVLAWDLPGPVIDKHSTGGVGDMISLILAPVLAASGCYVPMFSGRALAHTGGTIDKLESIAGYNVKPDTAVFQKCVAQTGLGIIGQTGQLALADQRFYAIRDECATVESVPLICASILAKKMAAGLDGLVMDIKVGNGAFMPDKQCHGQ
jgi:thymidine phosphorylase